MFVYVLEEADEGEEVEEERRGGEEGEPASCCALKFCDICSLQLECVYFYTAQPQAKSSTGTAG